MHDDLSIDAESPFTEAFAVNPEDFEAARARAAISARLLGKPTTPLTIGRYIVIERLGAGGMGIVYAAYDPELDRKVALKLLFRNEASDAERHRLVREAKAMAKLSHPNVVHVYDAGEHEGRVFVAMELVRGATLRAWTRSAPRSTRETLAVCLDAGRGLAAAHAAGIVHRDFKPDNVLVGDDGRARVLDFGLARGVAEAEETGPITHRRGVHPRNPVTRTGAVVGTPGYIAREQLRGEPPDVQSDQFSFCATVWEALTGALPYPREQHTAPDLPWQIAAPPRASMPRWVERVLRRGLADHDRYPRLDELLRALARDPAQLRRRIVGGVLVLASVGGAFAIGTSSREHASSEAACSGGAPALHDAWPLADREAAVANVAALGTEYANLLAPRLASQLDEHATAWIDQHREACLAHRRGEQSAELLDRRMTCLDRSKRALVTVGGLMREATDADLPGIVLAASSLPHPQLCADLEGLAPAMPSAPAEARPIAERLEEVQTLALAGKHGDANVLVDAVVVDARALGHGPLLAEALLTQGKILTELVGRADGAPALREAIDVAMRSGVDELVVHAWGSLAWAIATDPTRGPAHVPEGRALIVAMAERRPKSLTTLGLYRSLAVVELAGNDHEAAREMYARVVALASEHADPRVARIHADALNGLAECETDPTARVRMGEQAIALMVEAAGAEHPGTLWMRRISAIQRPDAHDVLAALASVCDDTRRLHGKDREDPETCWKLPALLAELVGDEARSVAAAQEWARLAPDRSRPFALAYLALRGGDAATAEAGFAQIVAQLESRSARPWWVEAELAEAEVALGRAQRALGRREAAATIERGIRRLAGDRGWLAPRAAWLLRHAQAVQAGAIHDKI
ncbi:MAG TPA: serine/threonine-protein kinase [Nannocystaceae bacterium]|nr:serine/threonine-protein kinase [Nannocystaceae bacterium]